MTDRTSKRLGIHITPGDLALAAVPESPTNMPSQHPQHSQYAPLSDGPSSSSSSSQPPSSMSTRNRSQSASYSRPRKSSMRRNAPSGLKLDENKLVPRRMGGDFPSPGSAPRGQRIFDASAFAERRGVETAEPGWAVDSRTQEKLEDDHYKAEHPEEQENMGQKISRSLSTVKRSASLSVKRAKSLRRPRNDTVTAEHVEAMPPPYEDEDAKMVRMSVVKPHNN